MYNVENYNKLQHYLDELSKPYKTLNLKDEREEAIGITMEQLDKEMEAHEEYKRKYHYLYHLEKKMATFTD